MGRIILATACLAGLPLLGLLAADVPLAPYLEFPPRSVHIGHAPFSIPVFLAGLLVALPVAACLGGILLYASRGRGSTQARRRRFPWWGWSALAALLLSWTLAWTRYPWFAPWQPLTYTPVWLSFIMLINAHTRFRTGRCLLLDRTRLFLALFPASSLFWWYFEYLNRFVQNWHYLGIDDFSPLTYAVHSSIAFSTVLPAVMSVMEWLLAFPGFQHSLWRRNLPPRPGTPLVLLVLAVSILTLFAVGLYPGILFPLLWISPLLLVVSIQYLSGSPTIFAPLQRGDWRVLYLPAVAALACGLCWELWNYHSSAKWIYLIPYVDRWRIFEMPLLGYLGYLPFGLQCLLGADLLSRFMTNRGFYDSITGPNGNHDP